MKRIIMLGCLLVTSIAILSQEVKDSFYSLTPVEVRAVRAGENAPFTKTNISRKEIAKINLGQDIPFLLNQTPSVVVNSDAGNGVGYTGIRIRGADATRINVTLNGIPYNDAESQGTFFVDLPDFSSSTGSIQIQRGVGTSSNGAGAFGGNINFSTNEVVKEQYAEINNSIGSFNTRKHTIKAGTGLQNGFVTDVRFSKIKSDGFIDRASSNLKSFFFSTAYVKEKTTVRVNVFSGKERTYQAWNGISETDLKSGKRTVNSAGTEKPGNPYDNEVDDYTQTHYQLFFNQQLSKKLNFNTAFFFTKGKGFYEQYKANQQYAKYSMPNPPSTTRSDMIRQLWLDNDFFGNIFSLQLKANQTEAVLGGGITRYNGNHFGKIIWAEKGLTSLDNWYNLDSRKDDVNIFIKQQTKFSDNWHWFYDLQFRHVNYTTDGFRDNPTLFTKKNFNFFNPKAGVSFVSNGWKAYVSYSIANKEPNRDDFEAGAVQQPLPERLHDVEAGLEKQTSKYNWAATVFYMRYKNQLVLTGKINDVGAYTRTNIPNSYRAGLELQGGIQFNSWVSAAGNISFSKNKVKNFTEYIDDYDNGGQQSKNFSSSTIAYSPSIVGGATINFIPIKNGEISLLSKYVSRQFLDNTGEDTRSLNPFYVQDIRAIYTVKIKCIKEINIIAQINNVFDKKYEPNGYTYSYFAGGETVTENFYFPMAGTNFMLGLNVKL